MKLSYKDIRLLAEQQLKLCRMDEEIANLREILEQLAYDNCSIRVCISVSNHSLAELKEQQQEVERIVNGTNTIDGGVNNYTGKPVQKKPLYQPAKHVDLFTESAGIRVLQSIMEEKIADRNAVALEVRNLFSSSATEAPTLDRYQAATSPIPSNTIVFHEHL